MLLSENFIIDQLKSTDATTLHFFLLDNTAHLSKFFPLTLSSNETIEKSVAYILEKNDEIRRKVNFTFVIRELDTQHIAGLIMIKKIDWVGRIGELAYCIGRDFERKGLVTKAVKAISGFAYDELDLKVLQIIAHKTNVGSVKVAENCDFIWKRTLLNEFTPIGESPLDMELYEHTNER